MADACVHLMQLEEAAAADLFGAGAPPLVNIGCGEDLTIRELAETVAAVVGFQGRLCFDSSKPDGTPRKLLDVERLQALGWRPKTSLAAGIGLAYADFLGAKG